VAVEEKLDGGSSPLVRGTDFLYFLKIIEQIKLQNFHQLLPG